MSTNRHGQVRSRLLAVIAVVLGIGALKVSAPVTLPLAFALFLIALFWPLQRRLERRLSQGAATLLTLVACLLTLAAFAGALYLAGQRVAEQGTQYADQLRQMAEQARSWLQARGLPAPGSSGSGLASGAGFVETAVQRVFSFAGSLVLVIAFFVLGLLEVHAFRRKMERGFPHEDIRSWLDPVRHIARDTQRYLVVRTGVGLVTGAGVTIACWLIGLEFAILWGLLNFLLNYIPTLGSIIAVAPPALFALVQGGPGMALLTLTTVGGVQLLMGNYVDPLAQGKYLELSPLVVLASVVFWGWVWGVAGAFIGIPLTVVIVIACSRFEQTRWIAVLLAREGADAIPGAEEERQAD